MKCLNCKKEIDDDSCFCVFCGSKVNSVADERKIDVKIKILNWTLALWVVFKVGVYGMFGTLVTYESILMLVIVGLWFYLKKKNKLRECVNRMLYITLITFVLGIFIFFLLYDDFYYYLNW